MEETARRLPRAGRQAPEIDRGATVEHLGTLGTGNHFIEPVSTRPSGVGHAALWLAPATASGTYFIELAQKDMRQHLRYLPDQDLAYFTEGAEHFDDYVFAVGWAQRFARTNRDLMMQSILDALSWTDDLPKFTHGEVAVNCHHNYVQQEEHFGATVFVTRKGAVRAGLGELGIIPGSRARARTSWPARATRRASARAATARVARCRAVRRSAASPSRITRRRPRASSAARTAT